MNFRFKLSRRMSMIHSAVLLATALSACSDSPTATAPQTPAPNTGSSNVSSVLVSPASASVAVGGTTQLAAAVLDTAGAQIAAPSISWTSVNTGIATVTSTGEINGVASGTTQVIATSAGKADTAQVTVAGGAAPPSTPQTHGGYYVSPTGSAGAAGTRSAPWSIEHAFTGAGGRIQPGDTVWLLGGTYRGHWRTTASGTAGRPVVFRQYPGERATLDGNGTAAGTSVLYVGGQYSVFWGFEITNSNTTRTTGSTANNVRSNVVANYASHTKYINMTVHDGGVAFYNEPQFSDVEIIGNVIYNNGWMGPDRGHGHAIYLKSDGTGVVARDNVIFNQFGYGLHLYSNAGSGNLNNIRLEGNVAFNNGTQATSGTSANILLGGDAPATGDVLVDNMTYMSPGAAVDKNVSIGYGTTANGSVTLSNNYFVGGRTVLNFGFWSSATVTGNTLVGSSTMVNLQDSPSGYNWSGTQSYQQDPLSSSWWYEGVSFAAATWRTRTGLGASDQVAAGTPTNTKVVVRKSPYETGRANIIVYNWGGQGAVSVNLAGAVPNGARYEIRNAQNPFGSPVASGTFSGGTVSVPMAAVTPPAPVGWSNRSPSTGTAFNVYIVSVVS